jgi:hypothetical protein
VILAWTITVALDRYEGEGRIDVGTITATWTEPDGGIFTFTKQHLVSVEGRAKFMTLAEAALAKWLDKATIEKPIASAMTATANRVK